ncbi:hypothetical protein TNCV_4774301 [Trichonephila clavipes]|nr:hypothetical protein TNCV_4774301 [Trichonephila clavipes]
MLRSSMVQLISGRMLLYQSTFKSSLDSIKFNKSSKTSCPKEKRFSEPVLQLNSASEENVLLKEDQTDLWCLRPQCPKEKRFSEAVLRLNSASERKSVLLKEDQTDL